MRILNFSNCLVISLAFLLSALLTACGSSADNTAQPTTGESSPAVTATGGRVDGVKREAHRANNEGADRGSREYTRPAGRVSPQSSQFKQYSGAKHLHLAEFGSEASTNEHAEVNSVVVAYLKTIGAHDWAKACGYLATPVRAQITGLADGGSAGNVRCGAALDQAIRAFSLPEYRSPVYADEGITSLRIQEGGESGQTSGFSLFHGSDSHDYWMALRREGDRWRLLSTAPQLFR